MASTRKRRKPKVHNQQSINARRRADRAERSRRRARTVRRQQERRHYKFKVKVVRHYRKLSEQVSEKRAVELTLARYQPREEWHLPLCKSSIRQWHRQATKEGFRALYPKSTRPKSIQYQVPEMVVGIIFSVRTVLGWGGHRIAVEMKGRGIAQLTGRTVYKVFERLGLPVKVYALKGRSDGIAYRRYEKKRANAQWHIDIKHTTLADGTKLYICIIIDEHSRYALAAMAGTSATTEWVARVTQQAFQRGGTPDQLVSDNGREFISVWEESLTQCGKLLAEHGIEHLNCAPYYPQGNGKAEAFIKTINRELLAGHSFESLQQLQQALDKYLLYYNNYRRHSALGWHTPVTRYTQRATLCRGLAGIPGLEAMAADPRWGDSTCDPPIAITPLTAQNAGAMVLRTEQLPAVA